MKCIKFPEIIEDLVYNGNKMIISIFQIFEMTGDKLDLAENLLLLYKNSFKKILNDIINKQEIFFAKK